MYFPCGGLLQVNLGLMAALAQALGRKDFCKTWSQKGPVDLRVWLPAYLRSLPSPIALIFDLITSVKQKHFFWKESQTPLQDAWTCWIYVNSVYKQLINSGRSDRFFFSLGNASLMTSQSFTLKCLFNHTFFRINSY